MKNKKTLVAIVAILLIIGVGVTFAYFSSEDSFANLFNAGIYRIIDQEQFVSPDNWLPGETIPKVVTTKNTGSINAAVRISYTEKWEDSDTNDISSQIDPNPAIINFTNTSDWVLNNGYYYYKYILKPNDETNSFISGVTLDPNLNSVTCTGEGNEKVCESTNLATGSKYTLTITIDTVQVDAYQSVWNTNVEITEKPDNTVTILSGTKGNLQPGDMIGIGETEDFYVLSSDNSENGKTVLLAKYNLYVGQKYDDQYEYIGMIQTTDSGYGLQSELAIGGYFQQFAAGIVPFSSTNYWADGNTLLSPYNENNTIYFDNNTPYSYDRFISTIDNSEAYPYVYDSNSNLYQYISGADGYVNRLISMGAPSTITGRLLTYEEAQNNVSVEDNGVSIIYDYHQSYWLGSASHIYYVNLIFQGNEHIGSGYYDEENDSYGCGIRPVIEIPTREIQ